MIRVLDATSADTFLASQSRTATCTSWACSGEATLPVPIAHTGSYAITMLSQLGTASVNYKGCILHSPRRIKNYIWCHGNENRQISVLKFVYGYSPWLWICDRDINKQLKPTNHPNRSKSACLRFRLFIPVVWLFNESANGLNLDPGMKNRTSHLTFIFFLQVAVTHMCYIYKLSLSFYFNMNYKF